MALGFCCNAECNNWSPLLAFFNVLEHKVILNPFFISSFSDDHTRAQQGMRHFSVLEPALSEHIFKLSLEERGIFVMLVYLWKKCTSHSMIVYVLCLKSISRLQKPMSITFYTQHRRTAPRQQMDNSYPKYFPRIHFTSKDWLLHLGC